MCSALRAARSAVWVGSFAWLVKISTLSLFLHFNTFCCSDCDDNARLWVLRLFGGRASIYLNTLILQNMGRQFGSAVQLGWQNLVLVCEVSIFIVFRNSLHSSLLWHWRKLTSRFALVFLRFECGVACKVIYVRL